MLVAPPNEQDLEPRIISMGTCRVLRVKQVGAVFFVENDIGHIGDDGKRVEEWKVVAVSKGPTAYGESHQFLNNANKDVLQMMAADIAKQKQTRAAPGRL